jgi:hypothetical protein
MLVDADAAQRAPAFMLSGSNICKVPSDQDEVNMWL